MLISEAMVVWSPAAPDVPDARLQKNPQLLWLLGALLSYADKSLCEAIRADKIDTSNQ